MKFKRTVLQISCIVLPSDKHQRWQDAFLGDLVKQATVVLWGNAKPEDRNTGYRYQRVAVGWLLRLTGDCCMDLLN